VHDGSGADGSSGASSVAAPAVGIPESTAELQPLESLRRAIRAFGIITVLVGLFWTPMGVVLGDPYVAGVGLVSGLFGLWLLLEWRRSSARTTRALATRIALATQVTAIAAVLIEPIIGPALALGALIPVAAALVYVDRRRLTVIMLGSAFVGVVALIAPAVLPWGIRGGGAATILPTSTLIVVYTLFQIFLLNASSRLTDTAGELRAIVEMSHDLAMTLDARDVGNHLARHLQRVTGADDCTLSTWDIEHDRIATFGFQPLERADEIQPLFDLADYPETRRVLEQQVTVVLDIDDPGADGAEVEYLRSVGHRSLLMLPLVARGESVGLVELTSSRHRAFRAREIELAHLLAREAALTFDNARLHEVILQQAFRDPLTQLANRSQLQERIEHSLERLRGRSPKHAAVLFIDLDHFKLINDRFGHTKGDRLLQAVADRVRIAVRPGDTAARLGGDEFAILLEDVDGQEEAEAVALRLLETFEDPVDLGDAAPSIGASIGVALSGVGGETVDALLRNADIAMYAAKAAGRGQVVFFRSELLELASARSELAALLKGADARGELQLQFQPIVELGGERPVGVEALVRWQPRGHALHMPSEFIGLAEETGEILSIGRWVLTEACRSLRLWQLAFGLEDFRLYVNLSARQFRDPGLVSIVSAALDESGLAAGHLTLEITESALLTRTPETLERIAQLRSLGVRLAIDDFGTGYSSLGYLHAFQVDELKIDRSFVSGTPQPPDAHLLSRAIVELGRALGLDMVAEGIETPAQASFFRDLGCRYGQGFHFAKPMSSLDLERYLRRNLSSRGLDRRGPGAASARRVAGSSRSTVAEEPADLAARSGRRSA